MTPYEERRIASEQKAIAIREAIAEFTREVIIENLGVCNAWSNSVQITKYDITPNDVVELVILANKYNLIGELGTESSNTTNNTRIVVKFRYNDGN